MGWVDVSPACPPGQPAPGQALLTAASTLQAGRGVLECQGRAGGVLLTYPPNNTLCAKGSCCQERPTWEEPGGGGLSATKEGVGGGKNRNWGTGGCFSLALLFMNTVAWGTFTNLSNL